MFSNLPGKVSAVRSATTCEFYNSDYFDSMKEMVEANKASEALKLQYLKGEDWSCESPATVRVQGETDSFGAEYHHLCDGCYALDTEIQKYSTDKHKEDEATCEWCKKITTQKDIRVTRDIDEGSNGPVYDVCSECRIKQNDQINEELDYLDSLD